MHQPATSAASAARLVCLGLLLAASGPGLCLLFMPSPPPPRSRPVKETPPMIINDLLCVARPARTTAAARRRPRSPAGLAIEGLEARRLMAADMPMPIDAPMPAHDATAAMDAADLGVMADLMPGHGDMPHPGDPARQGEHMAAMRLADPAAATHRAVASGPWSAAETWADGLLPTTGGQVLVPSGLTVTVDDVFEADLKSLRIDGTLRFDATANTELRVDTLVAAPGSLVEIGTPERPIGPAVTARVVFADLGPIDLAVDPNQLGRGAIFHGTTRIHGAAKTSFATLATPPRAGDTTLGLAAAPQGWQVGDRLVVAGTRADATGEEIAVVTGITGATVSLAEPLAFDHLPARADLEVHVGNLSRNVVFVSENASLDRRGHVMFMHNPDVAIAHAAFEDLGRTNKLEILDPPYFDEEGEFVEGTGLNPTGRYSVHFHRTGVDAAVAPATVTGSVVAGNPGWGFVNHSSHVEFTDNVAYDVTGAAFNTEAGDEIGSFVGNLAIKMHGSREEPQSRQIHGDFGHAGDGFWLQGPGVRVEGNVVAGATGSGLILYAEALFQDGLGITTFPSANLPDPTAAEGAEHVPVTLAPLAPFRGNTAYGSELGAQIYYHRTFIVIEEEQRPQAALEFQTSVMEDMLLWGNTFGMRINYTVDTTFRNIEIIGPADGLGDTGFDALNFYNRGTHRYENLQIEGYEVGFAVPRSGEITVEGGRFDNLVDFMITEPRQLGRRLLFTGDIAFGDLETGVVNGETIERMHFEMAADQRPAADSANEHYFLDDQVLLDFGPYGGQQLYFYEQEADHVLFPEMPEQLTPDDPGPEVGEEIIGLTNAEIRAEFELSVGGAIVPEDAVELERIAGLLGSQAAGLPDLDPNPLPETDGVEPPVDPGDPDDPVANETIVEVAAGETLIDATVHAGDETIVKLGDGRLVLDLANTHTGGLRIEAGEVVIRNVAALAAGPVVVGPGATLTLDTGTARVEIAGLRLDPTGLVDLGAGGLVIAPGGSDAAAIRTAVIAGRNGGGWDGLAGITSAAAATTPGRAVGSAQQADGSMVVALAAIGDTDLDGQVNVLDLVAIDSSGRFGSELPASWSQGDFDYSGLTNAFDLIAVDAGGAFGAASSLAAPSTPPATAASGPLSSEAEAAVVPLTGLSAAQLAFASLAAEADDE